MQNKSFTLIELLVVIAIIGLIASVVLVNVGGLQGKARLTKTLEFSSSINNALGAYAVGVWGFDEGSGTIARDGSGYNNNGTLYGGAVVCSNPPTAGCPTWTDDTPHKAIGRGTGRWALSFDGVDDYVDVGNGASLNPTNEITVEAWVKPSDLGVNQKGIVSSYYAAGNSSYWLDSQNNTFRFWVDHAWASVVSISAPASKWFHIVGTYKSGDFRIYVNGVQEAKRTDITGSLSTPITKLTIGNLMDGGGGTRFFNGLIDEVKIYEKAMSLGEIQQHYAEGLQRYQDLAVNNY